MGGEQVTLRVQRVGLAAVAVLDACLLLWHVRSFALGDDRFIRGLAFAAAARSPLAELGVVTSVALSVWFAQARVAWLPGALLLLSLRLQHEMQGAATGIYEEPIYHCGSALLGWTLGTLAAMGAGARPARSQGERLWVERVASTGALAMLAATWVTAGVCKVRASSFDWVSGDTLRLVAVIHAKPGHHLWRASFAEILVASPVLAEVLTGASLVIELLAFLVLCKGRVRLLWSLCIVGFHVGTFLVAGIFFFEAAFLLVLLGVSWGELGRRGGAGALALVPWGPRPERERAAAKAVAGATAAVALGVWVAPIRMRDHPLEEAFEARAAASAAVRAARAWSTTDIQTFGPLTAGDELALGFRVRLMRRTASTLRIETRDRTGRSLWFVLAPPGVEGASDFACGTASLTVQRDGVGDEIVGPVGRALAAALRKGSGSSDPGEMFGAWLNGP